MGYDFKRMDDIIRARYRDNGYAIYWLLFGSEDNPEKCDTSRIKSDLLTICPEDNMICAGISYRQHTIEKLYPDTGHILAQLPPDIDELVIGGFHFDDCVDLLARDAHEKGMNVRVDEDATDGFIPLTILCGPIPLIRERFPTLDEMEIFMEHDRKMAISYRQERPWLMQIS